METFLWVSFETSSCTCLAVGASPCWARLWSLFIKAASCFSDRQALRRPPRPCRCNPFGPRRLYWPTHSQTACLETRSKLATWWAGNGPLMVIQTATRRWYSSRFRAFRTHAFSWISDSHGRINAGLRKSCFSLLPWYNTLVLISNTCFNPVRLTPCAGLPHNNKGKRGSQRTKRTRMDFSTSEGLKMPILLIQQLTKHLPGEHSGL